MSYFSKPRPDGHESLHPSTVAVHADQHLSSVPDIAPPIHTSTTYRYPTKAADLEKFSSNILPTYLDPARESVPLIYSRLSSPSSSRLEVTLAALLGGHATVYASGLAAFHALLIRLNPKRLLIGGGYHGCHGVAEMHTRISGMKICSLDTDPAEGDLVHLETPVNPYGTALSIQHYADRAHAAGALLSVDSTFAPPPLQDPWKHGADWVLHSATKYIGGHSDLLAGVLLTKDASMAEKLRTERIFLGSIMGGLESWLGLRSLRTFELRVTRQSKTAEFLVKWIKDELATEGSVVSKVVQKVVHSSVQDEGRGEWLEGQMPGGHSPVFAIYMKNEVVAKEVPGKLGLWMHCTSLGGVESLIEWRRMTDEGADRCLLRLSTGVEHAEDLQEDLKRGFSAVLELAS